MKIRIAYKDDELEEKNAINLFIMSRFALVKVHEAAPKDGFRHTFLIIPNVKKPELKRFLG